jgi:hypothetical protein
MSKLFEPEANRFQNKGDSQIGLRVDRAGEELKVKPKTHPHKPTMGHPPRFCGL